MKSVVEDISVFQDHFKVIANLEFTHVKAVKEQVELDVLIPIVGEDTWNTVIDRVDSGGEPLDTELIERIKRAVVWCTIRDGIDILNVEIGASGITVDTNEDSVPASSARVEQLRRTLTSQSYKMLDQVIQYLEQHVDVYTDYGNHPEYKLKQTLLVRNASELNEFINIEANRYVFSKLLPHIQRVQRRTISSNICKPFIDDVLGKLNSEDALEAKYFAPIDLLRSCISYLAIAASIPTLANKFDHLGISLFSNSEPATASNKKGADAAERRELIKDFEKRGREDLEELKQYLTSHYSDFDSLSECEEFVPNTTVESDYSIKTEPGGSIAL